jgi:hypothetical protein
LLDSKLFSYLRRLSTEGRLIFLATKYMQLSFCTSADSIFYVAASIALASGIVAPAEGIELISRMKLSLSVE